MGCRKSDILALSNEYSSDCKIVRSSCSMKGSCNCAHILVCVFHIVVQLLILTHRLELNLSNLQEECDEFLVTLILVFVSLFLG